MGKPHTPAEYAEMWKSWNDQVGKRHEGRLCSLVEIAQCRCHGSLALPTPGAMWRSKYDMPARSVRGP